MYVHGFADEMGEDLENIVEAFKILNKYGKLWMFHPSHAADYAEQGTSLRNTN
jgi:hypothetical protein